MRCLASKLKGPSSDPQHPHLGGVGCACSPNAGVVATGGALALTDSQANRSAELRVQEETSSQKLKWRAFEEETRH